MAMETLRRIGSRPIMGRRPQGSEALGCDHLDLK